MNNTKKIFALIVLVLGLFTIIMVYCNRHYTREAFVESNNGEELVFTDIRGHMWGWTIETIEEFKLKEGDIVKLKFDTNGTDEIIEDDILIKIKKIS